MRSRRMPERPLIEKMVSGIGHNCSVMAARVTLKAINDELLRRGHVARLEKTSDYFYFFGGEATHWIDRTVLGTTVGARSLEQWVSEFVRLKKLNAEMMQSPKATKKAR